MSKSNHKISNFKRKWILIGVLVFFAGQLIMPIAVTPRQANAFLGLSVTVGDIPRIIWDAVSNAIKKAGAIAFKNAAKTFANNLAYNAAVQITTGEKGQKPLFTIQPEKILKQAADVAAGDFLDNLVTEWSGKTSCLGYTSENCTEDRHCPNPVLNCDAAKLSFEEKESCSDSIDSMNICIAKGCTIYTLKNKKDYDELFGDYDEELGGFPVPKIYGFSGSIEDGTFVDWMSLGVEGAPQCTNDSGFSLCDQTDLFKVDINIKTRASLNPSSSSSDAIAGKCPVTDIINTMENNVADANNLYKDLTNKEQTDLYLQQIAKGFNPEASQLGAFITISNEAKSKSAEAEKNKEFSEQLSGGLSSVTSKITGAVKTPGPLLEGAINSTFGTSLDLQNTFTGEIVADAIGTFTSTLASKMMAKYFSGLADESSVNGGNSGSLGGLLSGIRSGVTAAKLIFADLKKVDYSVGGNLDILSSLAGCPDSTNPTPDTCVIDTSFSTAIQQQLTVREALEAGLLDGNKIFGYDLNGNQPNYFNGYPYRSLVILRKYRVIPVGWELAATYMKEFSPGNYSLNTLIAAYDDSNSPFYHLVDPNWVLKAPEVFCAREGTGEKIVYSDAISSDDTNQDGTIDNNDAATPIITRDSKYCADEQLCLVENDDGSCKKYGYCVEEKPIWKFVGTACEEQYNSCQSFDQGLSYLTNTLNYNGCNSGNAGCQWYCQDYDLTSKEWQCTNQDPPAGGNKISFNDQAESCSASGEGCSEFIPIANSGANLVKNSGFEEFDTAADPAKATDGIRDNNFTADLGGTGYPDDFTYWWHDEISPVTLGPCRQRSLASTDVWSGLTSARIHRYADACTNPSDGTYMSQRVDTGYLTDSRTFTVSFYAKTTNDAICDSTNDIVGIDMTRDFAPLQADTQYVGLQEVHVSDNWTRFGMTFTFDSQPASRWTHPANTIDFYQRNLILFIRHNSLNAGNHCDVLVDNVQLEEGGLTDYKAYEDSSKTYLKKAPDYLNCTGSVFDNEACQNFAQYCSTDEVGCQAYTSDRTGQSVTGTITNINTCDPNDPASCDQCPAEFVGCQAYRELATENVPYRPAVDPVSFIESTGLSCPASAVGCEEYTNLDVVAQGGEGKEYFSWIKQCVNEDDPNIATYYTWEGSDEFGFQLKDYKLKNSNLAAGGPCTNMGPEDPYMNALGLGWNNCIDDASVDRNADGTDDEFYPMASCTLADVGVNPDCAEFIDTLGNRFYRLKSKVIYADANCKIYRNSIDSGATCQGSVGAQFCTNTNSVCTTDATCTDILYHLVPSQGNSCQAQYAGCRAYKGNAGDNSHIIYEENFENGTVGDWTGVSYSNEAVSFGGHSILANSTFEITDTSVADIKFEAKKSYNISFWAKAGIIDTPIQFKLSDGFSDYSFPGQTVARTGEWNYYELGPLYIPEDFTAAVRLYSDPANPIYLDNIIISEIIENIYQIKDSYTECAGYENCDQYKDIPGATHYLKSFSSLCSNDKIGCEAMIDTQNSSRPDTLDYEVATGVTQTVPADSTVLIVNDPDKRCTVEDKGCEILGLPTLDEDGIVSSYDNVFIKNDPDKYDTDLCKFEESSCNEYTTPEGSKYYFKDPGANICEYKRVAGQTNSGWYKNGTNSGVPDCPVTVGVCKNSDADYQGKACSTNLDCNDPLAPGTGICAIGYCEDEATLCFDNSTCVAAGLTTCTPAFDVISQPNNGWTGSCPETASTCTEYRDPEAPTYIDSADTSLLNSCDINLVDGGGDDEHSYDCNSYYYLSNDIDASSCNGLVNRDEGCLLFDDTSQPVLSYYSSETKDGEIPSVTCDSSLATCTSTSQDSNIIVKVTKDRICGRWIDSATSIPKDQKNISSGSLSTSINICDEMDNQTTSCVGWDKKLSAINQTYSTPTFVDKIKNYSGLVMAGLDWDRRCTDNANQICKQSLCDDGTNTSCSSNDDCLPGIVCNNGCGGDDSKCSEPQLYEGNIPTAAMKQVGSIGLNGDLIRNGDFGDSDYKINQKLSCALSMVSGSDCDDPIASASIGDTEYDINSSFSSNWGPREFHDGTADVKWTEENGEVIAPSLNANLDENNIMKVRTSGYTGIDVNGENGVEDGNLTGVSYNLGSNITKDTQYTVSFKLRWSSAPTIFDKIRVELEYKDQAGNLNNWNQNFAADITPNKDWQEYVLGPIQAGYDDGNKELSSFGDVSLNIIHVYDTVNGGSVPAVTFYLDDVAMEPVLTIRNGFCETVSGVIYENTGKQCDSISDCVTTSFDDGAVRCTGLENVTRSCRLYPKDDARYCSYIDQNRTTFQGWNGYCLEHDPNNSDFCINWWPVDLLSGDADVFGALPPFDLKIRQPLYMCLEAEGNYSDQIFTDGWVKATSWNMCTGIEDDGCDPGPLNYDEGCAVTSIDRSILTDQPFGYRRPMVTSATFGTLDGGRDNCDEGGAPADWSVFLGGNFHGISWQCDSDSGEGCEQLSEGFNFLPEDRYYKWEIERIALIGQMYNQKSWDPTRVESDWTNGAWYNHASLSLGAYSGRSSRNLPDGKAYMVFTADELNDPAYESSSNPNCWSQSWCTYSDCSTGSNIFTYTICFDSNDRLTSGAVYFLDNDSGAGLAISSMVYLKDQCTRIVEVNNDLNENKAWASKLTSSSAYRVPKLDYTYNQFTNPYGGIRHPDVGDDPTDWSILTKQGPIYIRNDDFANAGSPYSFATPPSDSSGRICSVFDNGNGYSGQNLCLNQDDVDSCKTAGGYCIGVGQGFCEEDPTMFCQSATEAADCLGPDTNYYGPCRMGTGGAAGIVTPDEGMDLIRLLFAKTYGVWDWDATAGRYNPSDGGDTVNQFENTSKYNNMTLCLPGPRDNDKYCGIPPIVDMTFSNSTGTSIPLPEAGGRVQFTITIKADKDQLPISRIYIDWNRADGLTNDQELIGPFDSGTFVIDHVYNRSGAGSFQPAIKVIDNWDWCGVAEDEACNQSSSDTDCRNVVGHTCNWVEPDLTVNVS